MANGRALRAVRDRCAVALRAVHNRCAVASLRWFSVGPGMEGGDGMKLVFCGTPQFAVGTLEAVIAAGHQVALVVAQPDRAAGRGLQIQAGAVKAAALRHGLDVMQPEKIRHNEELRVRLGEIKPDAILVVAYGRIIPEWMLSLPRFGCINLHGSLLPKYRGAAPIQWAVANGETDTGVTTMQLDQGLDTGPILLSEHEWIAPDEMASELFARLTAIGAELMVKTLAGLDAGTIPPIEQDDGAATLAPILRRKDGRIGVDKTAQQVFDRWRGFYPWPGAWTMLRGRKLNIHQMRRAGLQAEAGELLIRDGHLFLACSTDAVELIEVQIEGKRKMNSAEFMRGFQVKSGERVGE